MKVPIDLKAMSVSEKMELLEAVWDDLVRAEVELKSPEWHREILREREERVKTGEEQFVDWEGAKGQLKRELSR